MQNSKPDMENEDIEAVTEETAEEETVLEPEMVDSDEEEALEGEIEEDDEEEMDEAEARIEELEEENEALKAQVLRTVADMENYKKRSEREKMESIKYANKSIILQMLDVLDNFDRALTSVTDPKDNFVIGVNMIHKQLLDVLGQNGVEEIDAKGRAFDPYLDEALASEVTTEFEENTVMEVFMKGYRYQGNLLRPSKVKVAAAPQESASDEDTEESTEASESNGEA